MVLPRRGVSALAWWLFALLIFLLLVGIYLFIRPYLDFGEYTSPARAEGLGNVCLALLF